MTRDELIAELKRLVDANEHDQPSAACVLAVLSGALYAQSDYDLGQQCLDFARSEIIRMKAGL